MEQEKKSPSSGSGRCENYQQEKVDALLTAMAMGWDMNLKMMTTCACERTAVLHRFFLHSVWDCGVSRPDFDQNNRAHLEEILNEHFQEIRNLADTIYNQKMGVKLQ